MANNVFVKIPERGDACVGRLSDKKLFYIKADTLVTSELDKSEWEVQGVVSHREGKKVTIIGLRNYGDTVFCNRVYSYLSGYTLDGAEHTIVLSIATKANWNKRVEKTITYTANTVEEFISALNAAFEADADFTDQDWYADLTADGRVRVHYIFSEWANGSFDAKSGIEITVSIPEMKTCRILRRNNGGTPAEGAIFYYEKALKSFLKDAGASEELGGRTSEQVSVKQKWPINLPTWLGTSTKNPGDFCKALREVYGEGAEGWRRFLRSCLPVVNTDGGGMMCDGIERSKLLSSLTYTSRKVAEPRCMFPAIEWCTNFSTSCLPAGSWYMGSAKEILSLVIDITTGTGGEDVINRTLKKAGGSRLSNDQSPYVAMRDSISGMYYAFGERGCISITPIYTAWYTGFPFSQQTLTFD